MSTVIDFASARQAAQRTAPAAKASVVAADVDPHLAREREASELYAKWMAAIDVDELVEDEACGAYWDRWRWIIETEPQTNAGLAVQLRTIPWITEAELPMDEREEAILHRVAEILEQLGGRAMV